MRRPRKPAGDGGETLLELAIAIAILGICVVAIATGVTVSIKTSRIHNEQSTAQQYLHNYAENLASNYTQCSGSTAPTYSTQAPSQPAGFGAPTVNVKFWNATSAGFASGTCPSSDPGLQQVTISLN